MIDTERTQFDAEVKELATEYIDGIRQHYADEDLPESATKGSRFFRTDYILALMESKVSQREFLRRPYASVVESLTEAARADHWYDAEKEYDLDIDNEDMEFDGEDD